VNTVEDKIRAATRAEAATLRELPPLRLPPAAGELPGPGAAGRARRARRFRTWVAPVTAAAAVVALAISLVIVRDIPNARVVSPAGPVNAASHSAAASVGPTTVVAYVQGFYRSYVAARKLGQRAAAAVVRGHVAAWYFPVLEAPTTAGVDPVECGLQGPVADWSFKQAGVHGGQTVIVIGSQPPGAPQELGIVATTMPGTGKITGITCSIGGDDVTSPGARDAVASLYGSYVSLRRAGVSLPDAIARLTQGGPESADPYLEQARYAIARQHLGYDPVTCAASGVPDVSDVSAGTTTLVAGSTVGVVKASAHRTQWLVTVVLGAKGWTIGDIACSELRGAVAMKSGVGAGAFEWAGSEGFNRAERAGRAHAVGSRPDRRPREYPGGERVGIPANQVHRGQFPAVRVGRHRHHVRADGRRRAGSGPAALNPPGGRVQGLVQPGQAAGRPGEGGSVVDEPGRAAEPAEVDAHVSELRLPGYAIPRRFQPS
jgi:hypothetical protein